jgi:hypothetical protein
VHGGAGSRITHALREAGNDIPVRNLGVPPKFPEHGKVSDVRAWAGLNVPAIGRRIVEWAVLVSQETDGGPPIGNGTANRATIPDGEPREDRTDE